MIVTPPTPTTAGPSTPRTPSSTRFAPTCASAYCTPSTAMAEGAIFPFPGPAPVLSQRELYLRALEQEREEILAEAYAAKRSGSPLSNYSDQYAHDSEDEDGDVQEGGHPRFDERGRQLRFRETVRQRQARLEFLRRQDFARRIAHRGLEDAKASAYAIKRLPPPRARPIERVNAATKIQRTWRLHHAVKSLENLTQRVRDAHERFLEESKTDYEDAWTTHAETLHELLRELGERTGVLASASQSQSSHSAGASSVNAKSDTHALHPRVRIAARTAMEALRSELSLLDRAQISRHHSFASSSSSSSKVPFLSGSFSDSEGEDGDDDFYYDDDEEDSDSDDEDSDYASYTYTPPQSQSQSLISTELYVVDEEDEDDLDLEEHIPSSNAMRLYTYPSPPASPTKSSMRAAHVRSRHAPVSMPLKVSPTTPSPIPSLTNVPSLIRSPLARSPSLASIPEEDEEF